MPLIFLKQHLVWFDNLLLSAQVPSTDRNALSSLWGKLASEILMQNWEAAMEDLTRLRETIDNNVRKLKRLFEVHIHFSGVLKKVA